MATPKEPDCLKFISPVLKTGKEFLKRDPVVTYYCNVYALQKSLQVLGKKRPREADLFLMGLMDHVEQLKKQLVGDEAVSSDIVAQAHVESKALQLFAYADNEDRSGRFGKNVIKAFYTSHILFEVLVQFGELSVDVMEKQKYAKWKAAYISRCMKEGQTPIAGPVEDEEEASGGGGGGEAAAAAPPGYQQPGPGYQQPGPGYQQPGPGYQQPGPGYQQPGPGYQQPGPGYQQPGPGYQQPGSGYAQAGGGSDAATAGFGGLAMGGMPSNNPGNAGDIPGFTPPMNPLSTFVPPTNPPTTFDQSSSPLPQLRPAGFAPPPATQSPSAATHNVPTFDPSGAAAANSAAMSSLQPQPAQPPSRSLTPSTSPAGSLRPTPAPRHHDPGKPMPLPTANDFKTLGFEQKARLEKLMKFSSAALMYDDMQTVAQQLTRAHNLVYHGREE